MRALKMFEQSKLYFSILLIIVFVILSCSKTEDKDALNKKYLKKGDEITNLAQAELLKNVSHAMQKGGPVYAIEFCNVRALPLLDSLSGDNDYRIKRIALRYRNPEDKPQTETEKAQLAGYMNSLLEGTGPEPEVLLLDDRIEYYKPIMLGMDACLKCHGEPGTQIGEATLKKISELYPEDTATGFGMGDFRGAWKVTFMK
jgi:hypothetical protein